MPVSSKDFRERIHVARATKDQELQDKYGLGFAEPARVFSLNNAEAGVIAEWLKALKPEILELQKGLYDDISPNEPYYGALGGGVKYSFTPTGFGDILIVKETITGKELNVHDALDWHFYG
jgi:hypothetical protein